MSKETPKFLKNLSVPRPSSGHLMAMGETDRPIAVFSDFDGTIFLQDTGHVLFDKFGCGKIKREEIDRSIGKTKTFRDASEELWSSLHVTLDEAKSELKRNLVIDPDFIHFFDYLQGKNVIFTIISAGMKPLLRAALDGFVGPERSAKIQIIANNGTISEDGKWKVRWLHDSPLGIDKSLAIKEWLRGWNTSKSPKPRVVFTGDGVSDLAAANQADIVFARQGLALEDYCINNMIPYIPYMRFKEALHDIKLLIKGNRYHDSDAAEKFRHARLMQLTGGLGPLSMAGNKSVSVSEPTRAAFNLADDGEDEDEDEDEDGPIHRMTNEQTNTTAAPVRPHTPVEDSMVNLKGSDDHRFTQREEPLRPHTPLEDPISIKGSLDREFSVGELQKLVV